MDGYVFLLDLALILLSTKVFGLLTKKFQMPQVVGALVAGLLLGPAMLGLIRETEFITDCAEIGVVVLMFCAGMETDINELKRTGKASFIIALMGVIIPLIGGFGVAWIFNRPSLIVTEDGLCSTFLQNVFVGVILTATSVSITVETLREMGKLKTSSGNAILGAAIIDDILGIIALTIITSLADTSVNVFIVLLKILGFFIFAGVAGFAYYKFYKYMCKRDVVSKHRHAIISFVFCLLMSYIAEVVFGVADITGAFVAGLVISCTHRSSYLASKFDVISYLFLSPIFFASIGLKVELPKMNAAIIGFALCLTLVAVLTKVIGCGVGAKICKYNNHQCMKIGVGMISRGEVALIVASKGAAVGLLGANFLGPIVIVVVITTIITPILLKVVYKEKYGATVFNENALSTSYDEVNQMREESEEAHKLTK